MSSYEQALKARIHTSLDAKTLERYADSHPRREDRPRTLPFKELRVADRVFQWRLRDENLAADIQHIRELARIIEDSERPLDPILITPVGDRFYVVDGHHRLEAYRLAKWRSPIPVTYFEGSLREGQEEAWRRNYKNKLPVTHADKLEAAWRLMKRGDRRQKDIHELTTISLRTIATMARVLKEGGPDVRKQRWAEARGLQRSASDDDLSGPDWVEKKAQEWAQRIFKNLGPRALSSLKADVLARALEIVNPALPSMLIAEWQDQALDVLGVSVNPFTKEVRVDWGDELEPTEDGGL